MSESEHHRRVKHVLADRINRGLESVEPDQADDLYIEKGLGSDYVGNIADVRFDMPHQGFEGFAFEVKSRCNRRERTRSIYQLAGYLRAGYHPVLVAPAEFYSSDTVDLSPKRHRIRYEELARSLHTEIVNVTTDEGTTLSPISHYQYDSMEDLLFDRTW